MQHSGVLGRGLAPGHTGCLLTLSSHTGRGEGALWGPIYEDTDAILEGATLIASQRPPPHTITLRVGFQRMNLGGTEAFSHSIIHVLVPGELPLKVH